MLTRSQRREVELPIRWSPLQLRALTPNASNHLIDPPFAQHERRRKAKSHVRIDKDKGCWSSIQQLGLQEGRCRSQQAVWITLFCVED
jgi:hypothetical protein